MCPRAVRSSASTCPSKLTRHLYLFVILIIWAELGGELGVQLSGHSKWKTIAHDKAVKDKKKSALFGKLTRDIHTAAAAGGGSTDPKLNSALAKAILEAQKSNLPAATIKKALEKMELRKRNPKPTFWAFKGPRGVYILVATLSDKPQRTKLELTAIARKHSKYTNVFSDPLSPFISKGWIFAKPPENTTNVTEKGLEDAIEAGAEEVEPDEDDPDILKFICESTELHKIKKELENRNYLIEDAYEMFIARMPVEISEKDMESVKKLQDELEDHMEVEKVYTNIA